MNRIIKFICAIAIIITIFISLFYVLSIESIDLWLTDLLLDDTQVKTDLVYNSDFDKVYGFHESDKPGICCYDDKLYMVIGDETVDITPQDINISYFGKIVDFNEIINHKKNCVVSDNGRYITYRLYFKDVSYLYYVDVEQKQSFFIDEKVDSFVVVDDGNDDKLTVIYATGYSEYNNLYNFTSAIYSNENEIVIGGEYSMISENIKSSGVLEEYGIVAYLNSNGMLFSYDIELDRKKNIAADIDYVYYPDDSLYNYDEYYKEFTICASKNGCDYIFNGETEVKIEKGYYEVIPKYTYKNDDGLFYYSNYNKRIILQSNGAEKTIYDELGDIYALLGYFMSDDNTYGYFIAATEDNIYMLRDDGTKAEPMLELSSYYKKNTDMLEKHMRLYRISDDVFYVNMLDSGSMIFNKNNVESWMSKIESYNYGLACIKKTNDGFETKMLNVPYSRCLSEPFNVSKYDNETGNLMYLSYFNDGTIRALSLLNTDGDLVKSDILSSATYSKGQCNINVYRCNNGTYILREGDNIEREFLLLEQNNTFFTPAGDEKGIYTENYEEFSVVVSFGTLVIF